MQIDSTTLKYHLQQRLKKHKMTLRIHHLLDEELAPLLEQQQQIDPFDLLVELILLADEQPARYLCALMIALDTNVIEHLEQYDIVNAAAFIHDTLQKDTVRGDLSCYRNQQAAKQGKKKQKQ